MELMILARTQLSVQAATTQRQLSRVEKRISDFQLTANVIARPLRSSLRHLCGRFDRLHLRLWDGGNPRGRAAPGAGFEPLPYELEDGSPILRNHLQPC